MYDIGDLFIYTCMQQRDCQSVHKAFLGGGKAWRSQMEAVGGQ